MTTPETTLKNKARTLFKSYGKDLWWFKVLGSEGQKSGVPDCVGCLRGKFFAVELKVEPYTPSPKQLWEIDQIRLAGGESEVIYDIDRLREFMQCLERKRK